MDDVERSYMPALGKRWLLPLYDPLLSIFGVSATQRRLIEQAGIRSGFRVLDIGCGTGTLAVQIKRLHPEVDVIGLDPDPEALSIARRKANRAGLSVEFDRGFADHMSYPDASFDRVFSSFMLHHLKRDERSATLREIRRVLKTSGSLHLLDFTPRDNAPAGTLGRLFHRAPHEAHHFEGRVTSLMSEAGLIEAKEVAKGKIFFGPIAYYSAQHAAG